MAGFKKRRAVSGQGLGEKLRQARLGKNISLAGAEARTKVQAKYLEALEAGRYQALPGNIYARAWIREYARLLDLPVAELLAEYNLEKRLSDSIGLLERPSQPARSVTGSGWLRPRNIKLALITTVIVAVLGYLVVELLNIIAAPAINISSPSSNFVTTESRISIAGQVTTGAELFINGERVLTDINGYFEQVVNLVPGLNKFQISAKKKHSRTRYLERNILRQ